MAALEPGKDPGDLAQHDPDALRRAVEESVPFLRFRFDRALAGQDLTSPEGKARAADRVLPVIAEHPDEIVRDQYVMDLADRLHLDPDRLRGRLKVGARREVEVVERVAAPSAASGRELEALRLLIHRRAEIADRLDATLFADPTAREAYTLLIDSPSVQDAAMAAELSTQDLLFRLTQEEATEGPTAVDVAALLVKDALGRMSAEVRRTDDIALMHEINGLMDRIQVPDVDVTVVDKALELLRGHGRGSTDERGESDE